MNFSLNVDDNSNEMSNNVSYQKPGVYDNVKITEIISGKSNVKQTPYIRMKTVNQNGEVGQSAYMYLSSEKGEGKKTAAWDITARNINDLICCTHNISRDEAKGIELVSSNETNQEKQISMLVDKLSSLLVGRPFRAKFKGEQTKEGGTVFSTLDRVESMNVPSVATGLKFNLDKDIKMFLSQDKVNSSIGTAVKNDDLPF